MEQFCITQRGNAEKINQLYQNYKKDGDSRKTKTYLEKKIAHLKELYQEYVQLDETIRQLPEVDTSHPYFDQRNEVVKTFNNFIEDMRKRLNMGPPTSPLPSIDNADSLKLPQFMIPQTSDTKTTATLLRLLKKNIKMRALYQEIDRSQDLIKANSNKLTLNLMLTEMQRMMELITELHENICLEATEEDETTEKYFTDDHYKHLKTEFNNIILKLLAEIETKPESNGQPFEIRLPPIEIPHFYGDYLKWISFADTFKKLIHDNHQLSHTHKINYLKSYIGGSAAKLISHLESTADNYDAAWGILNSRYNNRRLLITAHINTLLNQQAIATESAASLRSLHDTTMECLYGIRNAGIDIENWNSFLIIILSKKFDSETRRLYESSLKDPRDFQSTTEFLKFLEGRFKSLEAIGNHRPTTTAQQNKTPTGYRVHNGSNNQTNLKGFLSTAAQICKKCNGGHHISFCNQFSKMTLIERNQLVNLLNLCRNCLSDEHNLNKCKAGKKCTMCSGRHHNLLHSSNEPKASSSQNTQSSANVSSFNTGTNVNVLLGTALVKGTAKTGKTDLLRIIIDPGSQATFITEAAVKKLGLKKISCYAKVKGMAGIDAGNIIHKTKLTIQPRFLSDFALEIKPLILRNISKDLPDQGINWKNWDHIQRLIWADPSFHTPGSIDILLGADNYADIITGQIIKGNKNEPLAQNSEFGWIIMGNFCAANVLPTQVNSMISTIDIDKQLKLFWEIEEVNSKREPTQQEDDCEKYYQKTTKRLQNGRYEVRIPFKNIKEKPLLGNTKPKAFARLLQMEKQFKRNENLRQKYVEFMDEFIALNHMEVITNEEQHGISQDYYLPHHGVLKESSTTTKLRVVFDASTTSTNGVCLNDLMLVGPTVQDDLFTILLRWRKYRYTFTADIEKMFRQVQLHSEDQRCQKILWRRSISEPIQSYRLKTVIYGTAAATFLATRTLRQLAEDEKEQYPIAAEIAKTDFYVDDLLSGADTIKDALEAQSELIRMLKSGGFNLRKWSSNSSIIRTAVPKDAREIGLHKIEFDSTIKTLGIYWNPKTDNFEFNVKLDDEDGAPTKRKILSQASKLFDPLGWLSPSIITAKILLQDLWLAGVDWDDILESNLSKRWTKYKHSLKGLEDIKIPRWLSTKPSGNIELHGFCDASEKAYAAVIYCKTYHNDQPAIITLLTAKSKVAPIKTKQTLPRLELCAAVLLCKLYNKITDAIKVEAKFFAWSDSEIVLAWIRGNPCKWKTFVANRTIEIQKSLNPSQWNHVRSEDNPADLASRGIDPENLVKNNLWWQGPKWLKLQKYPIKQIETDVTMDVRRQVHIFTATTETTPSEFLLRYSSLTKSTRILAYCERFIKNARSRNKATGPLTTHEIQNAKLKLIILQQSSSFSSEIQNLRANEVRSKGNKLNSLHPFIDKSGILRVGGRLQNSGLAEQTKYPAILEYNSPLAKMVIDKAHKAVMHGGTQLTLATVRREFWIIKGGNAIKSAINRCVVCQRFKTLSHQQLMGNLPKPRVTINRPFTNTGVDYAGPIQIRATKGRGHKSYKGYIALFVCLTTKAVHIEVVSDLTSECFLAALKRFISRRGICKNIYSDNGTNFVGATKIMDRELKRCITEANQKAAAHYVNEGIQWHFIPPAAPHFGGIWEAAVKSFKHHFKRIVGETTLTYEELTTMANQIESILNSRPLCPLSTNIEDLFVLTPGHFLIGSSMNALPEADTTQESISPLNRWKFVQKMVQDFWRIWSTQYLNTLQQRYKWQKRQPNHEIGQLVLIKDETCNPTAWPLARIIATHPGPDGLVRVVTLKCRNSIIKRTLNKIVPLLIEDKNNVNSIVRENLIASNMTTLSTKNLSERKRACLELTPVKEKAPKLEARDWMRGTINPRVIELTKTLGNNPHKKSIMRIRPWKNPDTATDQSIKKKSGKIRSIGSIFRAILFLIIISQKVKSEDGARFTPLANNTGIYFEDISQANVIVSEWKLIVHYNLDSYWKELGEFQQSVQLMEIICNKTNKKVLASWNICHVIISQINLHLDQIIRQNNAILSTNKDDYKSKRQKRGYVNFIGNLAHDWFGVLDNRDAIIYNDHIAQLEKNENHMINLLKNQTSIADATINLFEKSQGKVQNQLKQFNEQLLLLNHVLNNEQLGNEEVQSFLGIALHVTLLLIRYQQTQNTIIDLIMHSHHGKINSILLTPQQLQQEMNTIRKHTPNDVVIPGTEDIVQQQGYGHVYSLIKAQTRIGEQRLIICLTIPLIKLDIFQIFNLIPIPFRHVREKVIVAPETKYLVVNLARDRYFPTNDMELNNRIPYKKGIMLLKPAGPIYTIQSARFLCEINILRHNSELHQSCRLQPFTNGSVWIKLNHADTWIYTLHQEEVIDVICGNRMMQKKINGSGIVQIDQNCMVKDSSIIISATAGGAIKIENSFVPSLKLNYQGGESISPELAIPLIETNFSNEIYQIKQKIKIQEEGEKLIDDVSHHDIHHYASIYFIILTSIIIAIILAIKRMKRHKQNRSSSSAKSVEIELHNIGQRLNNLTQPSTATRRSST